MARCASIRSVKKIDSLSLGQQPEIAASNHSGDALRAPAGKPRQQWMRRFEKMALDAERLCHRMLRLATDAEKAGELTPDRRERLLDTWRDSAQRFARVAEELERAAQHGAPIPAADEIDETDVGLD